MSHASPAHDAPLELLRETPRALLDLLEVAGVSITPGAAVEIVPATIHEAVPTHRAADLVALIRDARGDVALVVIVEVQRQKDLGKRHTWPLYAAQLEARHKTPAVLVVLALESARVAAWARAPQPPWATAPFAPLVLGPEAVGLLLLPDAASSAPPPPELPVLGAMALLAASSRRGAIDPAARRELAAAISHALTSIRALSSADRQAHLLALLQSVARHAEPRAILQGQLKEDGMNTLERIKKSARLEGKAEGVALGKAEGVALGKAEGVALGKAEGVALGKAEGVALGKAEGLLRLLRRRGFQVGPALEARIAGTRDVALLDTWFDSAIDATAVEAVFDD